MTWNYRVLEHVDLSHDKWYQVHEVYYNKDGSITSCTEDAIAPFGETVEELQDVVELMKAAFAMPTIPYEDI